MYDILKQHLREAVFAAILGVAAVVWILRRPSERPIPLGIPVAKVSELYIYPVKGMRSCSLASSEVDAFGLKYDRRWLVVAPRPQTPDETRTMLDMVTQRTAPKLATIETAVMWREGPTTDPRPLLDLVGYQSPVILHPEPSSGQVILRLVATLSRGEPSVIDVPVSLTGARGTACVWDDEVSGVIDQGDAVASWLQRHVGGLHEDIRLVYMPEYEPSRPLNGKYIRGETQRAGENYELDGGVEITNALSFADGFSGKTAFILSLPGVNILVRHMICCECAALILSHESVSELNRRMGGEGVSHNRFRANIYTTALNQEQGPNLEDRWKRFVIGSSGSVVCRGVKRCSRCVVTTTDQETGKQAGLTGEPLATMRTYRRGTQATKTEEVYMGMVRATSVCLSALKRHLTRAYRRTCMQRSTAEPGV
jgi:uncharacterized protein YcbX